MNLKKLLHNKRESSVADMLQVSINLILGAIAFLFFIYLMTQVIFFFWPPPNTNLIAINSVVNNVEFAANNFDTLITSQNITAQVAQMVVIPVPLRLDRNFSGIFTSKEKDVEIGAHLSENYVQLKKEADLLASNDRQQVIKSLILEIPPALKDEAKIYGEVAVQQAYAQNKLWFQTNKPSWWNITTQALPSMTGVDDALKFVDATVQQFENQSKEASNALRNLSELDEEFEDTLYATYFATLQLKGASGQAAVYHGETADLADSAHTVALWVDAGATVITLGEGVIARAIVKKAAWTATELAAEAAAKQAARQLALKVGTKTAGTDLSWGKVGNLLKRAKAAKEAAKDAAAVKRSTYGKYGRASIVAGATAWALYESDKVTEIGCRKIKTNVPFILDNSLPSELNFDFNKDSDVQLKTQYLAVQKTVGGDYFVMHLFSTKKELDDYLANRPNPIKLDSTEDYDTFVSLDVGAQSSEEKVSLLDEFCLYKLSS